MRHRWRLEEQPPDARPLPAPSPRPELLGAEIIDETDLYVDNQQTSRVDAGELSKSLPPRLRKVGCSRAALIATAVAQLLRLPHTAEEQW